MRSKVIVKQFSQDGEFARYDRIDIRKNVIKYKIVDDLLQCKQGRYKWGVDLYQMHEVTHKDKHVLIYAFTRYDRTHRRWNSNTH